MHDRYRSLESILQNFRQGGAFDENARAVLDEICLALEADLVFWHPGDESGSAKPIVTGRVAVEPDWCSRFIHDRLAATPAVQGQLLWADSDDPSKATSCVMVALGASNANWLVAVSFEEGHRFTAEDTKFIAVARSIFMQGLQKSRVVKQFKQSLLGLVRCLSAVIDARDPFSGGHSERVAQIAVVLGREMGLPKPDIDDLYIAGLLHDIGNIAIRDDILFRQGKLTSPEDLAAIQEHALVGDRIVGSVSQFARIRPVVRHHHERWDGDGYPDGIAGENIPLAARILAVADTCDALMSPRTYRPALSPKAIDKIIIGGSGSQFDPQVVKDFLACREQIYPPIYQKGIGDTATHAIDGLVSSLGLQAEGTALLKAIQEEDLADESDEL